MSFTVTVLGSSGSYASPDNPCTGYLLRSPGANVLLDCGPGTVGPLQQAIDFRDLTAIVISHCHPDHWLELPVLRNVFKYFEPGDNVAVYGTAETEQMNAAVTIAPTAGPFSWQTIDPASRLTIGDQSWSFALTDHPVETLASRVDVGDRSFVFTSDTGPAWDFADIGPGINLALADASHLREYENQNIPHMSARQAGERACAGGVDRLVITHLVPGSDPEAHRAEAQDAYGGPVDVALPGCVFEI